MFFYDSSVGTKIPYCMYGGTTVGTGTYLTTYHTYLVGRNTGTYLPTYLIFSRNNPVPKNLAVVKNILGF